MKARSLVSAQALILTHLGLTLGCKADGAHVVEPAPGPDASGAAIAPTATAAATASTTALARKPLGPNQCYERQDCGGKWPECAPAAVPGEPGHCEYPHSDLGRPLLIDGVARVAPYVNAGRTGAREVEALKHAARSEHASVAAFARALCELMALGAPSWLLHETQVALADEIRHTELTLAMVERLTGERPVLGALPEAVAPMRSSDDHAGDFFRDVFRGGAVGESLAAARAEREHDAAQDPALRAFYGTILTDEARHAALAFKTLRWLLVQRPALARVRDEEKARFAASGTFEERALVTPLLEVLG